MSCIPFRTCMMTQFYVQDHGQPCSALLRFVVNPRPVELRESSGSARLVGRVFHAVPVICLSDFPW